MRLWTVHPRYLDTRGLVAAWREALLAQKVLAGGCRGYRNHPQLARFRAQPDPVAAITTFLRALAVEAAARGYRFDTARILACASAGVILETQGQLAYEWRHLKRKLRVRSPLVARRLVRIALPDPHPLFRIIPGAVQVWEKTRGASSDALRRPRPRRDIPEAEPVSSPRTGRRSAGAVIRTVPRGVGLAAECRRRVS